MRPFEAMLIDCAAGPAEWRPAPAPSDKPHFARSLNAPHHTLCEDSWLNSAIFGKDYEWAPIANPAKHTIKLVEIRNPNPRLMVSPCGTGLILRPPS